jgi:hypothetical protein
LTPSPQLVAVLVGAAVLMALVALAALVVAGNTALVVLEHLVRVIMVLHHPLLELA